MNKQIALVAFASLGILLSSCTTSSPVMAYANTANTIIDIEEGITQENEFRMMIDGGQLHMQIPNMMGTSTMMGSIDMQNHMAEMRELMEIVHASQQVQNQYRIRIRMEASILRTLAAIMEENDLVLDETQAEQLVLEQTTLTGIKSDLQQIRQTIRGYLSTLRTQMRSVNRPMMWSTTLTANVNATLEAILPLLHTMETLFVDALTSMENIRGILLTVIPENLSPLTEAILSELALFESQLDTLTSLLQQVRTLRVSIRNLVREIRFQVTQLRQEGRTLTNAQKAALTLKQLAIQEARTSLGVILAQSKTVRDSIRGSLTFNQITFVNTQLATLITLATNSLQPLMDIQTLLTESKDILLAA